MRRTSASIMTRFAPSTNWTRSWTWSRCEHFTAVTNHLTSYQLNSAKRVRACYPGKGRYDVAI